MSAKKRRSKKTSEKLPAGAAAKYIYMYIKKIKGSTGGMKLSHFHSQSVVKLVSQSIQTVPTQRLLALRSAFHGCRRGGSTHFGTWKNTLHGRVPSDSSPVWTCCQNIDTGRGKQAAFHSHVRDTLSFWIIDIPGRGSAQDIRISSGLFHTSPAEAPVEPISERLHVVVSKRPRAATGV